MLSESDLVELFADIEEISQDSSSVDNFQLLHKLTNENKSLKIKLSKIRLSTKDVLGILRNEQQIKQNALQELENARVELLELQKNYEETQRLSVNNQFTYNEKINELEIKHQHEFENYKELAEDYLNVLSDATIFHNFEVDRNRNKIVIKSTKFLQDTSDGKFQKPHIISRRCSKVETNSTVIAKSTRSRRIKTPKHAPDDVATISDSAISKAKRRKLDIWDLKSISEASSPASFHDDGEISETESSYSFNTFSIGNETSFSLLQSSKVSKASNIKCKCHLEANEARLVSVGVNTDADDEPLCSLPMLRDSDDDFNQEEFISSSIVTDSFNTTKEINDATNEAIDVPQENTMSLNDSFASSSFEKFSTIGTNTDEILPGLIKTTCEKSTSFESISTSDKGTSTTRSTITRGTLTPKVVGRNFGMQFPEINLENILNEMLFELPDFIAPIKEDDVEKPPETVTQETQTDLLNVNREIIYANSISNVKETKSSSNNEEQSFILLGETLFNLFLNRLRESNKSLNDDVQTRQKLWSYMKHQLLSRFDELTFDEYFSSSITPNHDICEGFYNKTLNEDIKNVKLLQKDDFEAIAMDTNNVDSCNEQIENTLQSTDALKIIQPNEDVLNIQIDECREHSINVEECIASNENTEESSRNLEKINSLSECTSEVGTEKVASTHEDEAMESSKNEQECTKHDRKKEELEKILTDLFYLCELPSKLEPVKDFNDVIWSSIFPITESEEDHDCPEIDNDVLSGYDVEHEPIEIPFTSEHLQQTIDNFIEDEEEYDPESIKSLPSCLITKNSSYEPIDIPLDYVVRKQTNTLEYNNAVQHKMKNWKHQHLISTKKSDKKLCKIRKSLKAYLDSEWTDENLEICIAAISHKNLNLISEAIYETVEDNKWQKEINAEFTPPAPPLPRYQQKLILLINRLAEKNPKLPQLLMNQLDMKLFKCENSSLDIDYLRNISYYYTSIVDLFFDGNSTMVYYFIVKCIYFFGYKAIPMVFVLIKAFQLALPKKKEILKKYSTTVDWDSMTGLEMSKVRLDLEWMDSLELCVMYLLTSIQMYRRKNHESFVVSEHELFNYLPKLYGFPLNFITAPKMLDMLMKRLEDGELTNLSFSLILLGKRMREEFTIRTMLKDKLLPLLNKYVMEMSQSQNFEQKQIDQICLLVEVISTILKPLSSEREKSVKEVFPMIVNTLGRLNNRKIQEYCIQAILRLQRFIDNHKDIYNIIKHHYETHNSVSESLRHAVVTFIHRKQQAYFQN